MTAAQRRVFHALADVELESGGWPATIEAVAQRAGLASTATTHGHLHALKRLGVIERSPYARGGYRIKAGA